MVSLNCTQAPSFNFMCATILCIHTGTKVTGDSDVPTGDDDAAHTGEVMPLTPIEGA